MIKRLFLLFVSKIKSIFINSISFSSRVEYSTVSRKAKIWGNCKVIHSSIDDYSYVGGHCRVIHARIGKFCSIAGDYSQIGMGKHSLSYISTSSLFTATRNGTGSSWSKTSKFEEYDEIVIGNDVWIGSRVMILGGVYIGNGAVIGAGAVVTKNVPPYAIVGGIPARIIKYRFDDDVIEMLNNSEWWNLGEEVLKDNLDIFQNPLGNDNLSKIIQLTNKKNV